MQAFFAQSSEQLWHEMAKLRPLGLKDAAWAHPLGQLLAAEHLEVRGGVMDQSLVVPSDRVLGIARILLNADPEAAGESEVTVNPYRLIFREESTTGVVDNPFRDIPTIHPCRFDSMVEHLPRFIQRRLARHPFPVFCFGCFRTPISVKTQKCPLSTEMGVRITPKYASEAVGIQVESHQ